MNPSAGSIVSPKLLLMNKFDYNLPPGYHTQNMKSVQDPKSKSYLYQRIVGAKLFIDNNYAGKLDLDLISDEAFFSKFHFIRLFKKTYGKTPHQYLTVVRIEKAMQLLRTDKGPLEVCYAVGFESLSSFGSLFKRMTGLTPSSFLEEQQRIQTAISSTPLKFVPACFIYQHGWGEK